MSSRLPFAALAFTLILGSSLHADDSWVGEKVMPKTPKAKFGDWVGEREVYFDFKKTVVFPVIKEQDGWLRVLGDNGQEAWVDKDDMVLARDAQAHYTDLIRKNEKNSWAWRQRGNARDDKGEIDDIIKDYTEAIRLDPKDAVAYTDRGIAWSDKKDHDKAIADFNEAIRLDPKYAVAYNGRGCAWSDQKDYDNAIADFNEAIRLDPKDAGTYNNRGLMWSDKEEHHKALSDFNEAIRLDPKNADIYNARGHEWVVRGDFDKAIADYTEAIRLDPKDGLAYFNRAGVYRVFKKEYEKAIADYTKAIRIDPTEYLWLAAKGEMLATCPKESIRDGKKALELTKKACELTMYKEAWVVAALAAAHAELGQFDDAVKWQKKALEDKEYAEHESYNRGKEKLEKFEQKKPWATKEGESFSP